MTAPHVSTFGGAAVVQSTAVEHASHPIHVVFACKKQPTKVDVFSRTPGQPQTNHYRLISLNPGLPAIEPMVTNPSKQAMIQDCSIQKLHPKATEEAEALS